MIRITVSKVTVLDKNAQPVKGLNVTVTDKNNKTATKTTDANGQILVPVKTSGGGGGSSSGGGGGSYISTNTTNVKVTDKDGKTVNVSKSVDKDGKVTLMLPTGKTLDGDNYYTIITTDRSGKPKADVDITLKDKNGKSANGTTDKDGKLILPADEHKSYIVGYEDGEFKPEGNMTRAEATAIFARNIAERKGEKINNAKSSFTDVSINLWYNQYISYLEKYDIIEGYDDGTFKPDEQITRAEFVTMCARFYNLFDKTTDAKSNKFTDVASSHWAYKFINSATAMDWIRGYADGSFKPDNNITREIDIFGKRLNSKTYTEILRNIGSLIESPSYYGHLTGTENLKILQTLLDVPKKNIDEVLRIVRLDRQQNKNWIDEQGWADDKRGLEKAVKDKDNEYVLAVYSPETSISKGDKITTEIGDLTVASVVSHAPFDRSEGEEILICSEELFEKLTGSNKYTIIDIQMNKSATDEDVDTIRDLSDGYLFSDNRLGNKETKGAYYSFAVFVYGFLAIIAMISVFNIMNSISMSVSSRIKQYGAMRAIGMSIRQLRRMITAEAITYALCGCIVGCAVGFPIHRLIFVKLITSRWGDVWTVPFTTIAVIVLLTVLTSFVAVYAPAKRIKGMAITDTINEL